MNKYWKFYGIILGVFALLAVAFKQQNAEQEFLNRAFMSNQYEVAVSKLANEKSSSADTKAFGAMMITDHQKVMGELQNLAKTKGFTLTEGLDEQHQVKWDMLNKIDSAQFDQAFKADAIAAHEQAIALFDQASNDTSIENPELKNWIIMKLPSLKAHLEKAKTLNMKVDQSPMTGTPLQKSGSKMKH